MREPRPTCRDVVGLVSDYLDHELTADETELLERHLSSCDDCDRYVDQMRFTIEMVGRIRGQDVPAPTRDRLLAVFRRWKRS
jgi:anti-sigma factor RsiW